MKFDINAFFLKNWQHFVAIAFLIIVAIAFYQPQLDGKRLKQHDTEQWLGMAHESQEYRKETGKEPLWTNSMFGGMPATQISVTYPGSFFGKMRSWYFRSFPGARAYLLIHMLGFYVFALFLRIKPIIGVLGAIALSFSCYEIIIVQAGHITKSIATAFMAPTLGAFIYAYRGHRIWGILFATLFMGYELNANHLQVTYYLIFLLVAVGIYFLIKYIKDGDSKSFFITSGGLILGFVFATFMNIGNVLLTSEYAKHTIRGQNDLTITADGSEIDNQTSGLDRDYITNWSYGIGESFNMLSPSVMGGGSFGIGGSQFEEVVDNSEFSIPDQNDLKNMVPYWGEQPVTSGPTYIGIVVVLLAFLGMIFIQSKIKWPLLIITLLAVMLSWGKNFMGLTDLFIDYVPGYDKFRTVTIILVLVELCVVVLGVFFLSELVKKRDKIKEKKTTMALAIGGFFVFILIVKLVGIGNYTSTADARRQEGQLANISGQIRGQIMKADPKAVLDNVGVNVNDPAQVNQYVAREMKSYEENTQRTFINLRSIREDIFNESMNRSLLFIFITGGLILIFLYTSIPPLVLTGGALLLVMMDLIPIAYDYVGDEDKFWVEGNLVEYPVAANTGDREILAMEIAGDPDLRMAIDKTNKDAVALAAEGTYEGRARTNLIDAHVFSELNKRTNYRVFEFAGSFNSSRAAYFHKSVGGYHGAKLRNIANVIDFHLSKVNQSAYDILNVKYFIQQREDGSSVAVPRKTAMGNAWFIQKIETFKTPNEEIRGIGNVFDIKNSSDGQLFVQGTLVNKAKLYGGERVQYLIPGNDTMNIQIRNGLKQNQAACYVMDANGRIDLVPSFTLDNDTLDSFKELVRYELTNEFNPKTEAVMLKSVAKELGATEFSGEGTIKLDTYGPNKLEYSSSSGKNQFAVFSEVYYPTGWKAYIDDKEVEIHKTNYFLRGLEIPKGDHKIRFEFTQPNYHLGNSMGFYLSWLLILSFGVYAFIYYRNKNREKTEVID